MGYYRGWGDTKMFYSSEEEGYENHTFDIREKRYHISETLEEPLRVPITPISDDTDRQFWAEDELSNSESRQRLTVRKKRRHSPSYRNRTKKSQSCVHQSSDSSSDSICAEVLSKVRRVRRYCEYPVKLKAEELQFINTERSSSMNNIESIKDKAISITVFNSDQKLKNSNNCQEQLLSNTIEDATGTVQSKKDDSLKQK